MCLSSRKIISASFCCFSVSYTGGQPELAISYDKGGSGILEF